MAARVSSTEAWECTAWATSTMPPVQAGRLSLLLWARMGHSLQLAPETEGLKRCLLSAPSVIGELECIIEDSASPQQSKMGHAPPLRMWSSIFCLPMARSPAHPGLAWDVLCNLKALVYLDLISNMTALPTPTLCSQGNSSRLQEKKKRERKVPSPSPPNPFLSSCKRKYHICLQLHREWQSPTYCYLKINSECSVPVPRPTSSSHLSASLHVAVGKCRDRLSFKSYWLLFRYLVLFF